MQETIWTAIVCENADTTYDYSLIRQENGPEVAGIKLLRYYNTPPTLEALMKQGNVMQLGRQIGKRHDATDVEEPVQWCSFSHREHGFSLNSPYKLAPQDYVSVWNTLMRLGEMSMTNLEHVYVFTKSDHTWKALLMDQGTPVLIPLRIYLQGYLDAHFDHPASIDALLAAEPVAQPDLKEQPWLLEVREWQDFAPEDYGEESEENEHTDPVVLADMQTMQFVGGKDEVFHAEIFNYEEDGGLSYTVTLWRSGRACAQYEVSDTRYSPADLAACKAEIEAFLLRLVLDQETIQGMFDFVGF